ncbi:MAG: hypothetical protein N2Z20_00810 [Elusimicrobiales bacterium]|nr:hypothetical protein [Elusimicrobiales bacterium]
MKIAVIGYPLKKSLSNILYKTIYKLYELKTEFYAFETKQPQLIIQKMIEDRFSGFFVTIPYKKLFLNMTYPDIIVRKTGNLNCVKIDNKQLFSTNTDYLAIQKLIEMKNIKIEDKKATIIGNGSAAQTMITLLKEQKIKKLEIIVRGLTKTTKLKNLFKNMNFIDIRYASQINSDIFINATPLGMYEEFPKLEINTNLVIDFAYLDKNTNLIEYATKNKINFIEGKEILVMQGIFGLKHIFGVDFVDKYNDIYIKFKKIVEGA